MASGDFVSIKVDGLRDFQRSIKKLDSELPKALRVALNGVVDIVVDAAQPRVPHDTGRAAGSIKVASTQSAAKIKAGGKRAPYFPWLDFGGKRAGGHGGVVSRPYLKVGRYIWHAFAEHRIEIVAATENALVTVAQRAGLEVTQT